MFSYWHHIVLALSVSLLLIAPPAALGQTTSTDTAATAFSDSLAVAPGISLPAPGDSGSVTPADSVDTPPRSAPDSLPAFSVADTTRAPESATAAATRDSTRRPAAAAPAAPVDSILSAACGGAAGSTTVARDLLVVVFAAEAGPPERAAAAKSVDGKLAGSPEPGAYYLQIPARGQEHLLRAAADELVQLPYVRQVGSRACPSVRPEPTG